METKAAGIREQSAKYSRVQNLMHKVNEETLMSEHQKQSRRKAVGIDGVSKDQYHFISFSQNLTALIPRVSAILSSSAVSSAERLIFAAFTASST